MARQGSGRGFGSYPDVGLKAARSKAAEHRALIAKGIDPIEAERAARKAARPVPTFQDVAKLVIEDARNRPSTPRPATSGRAPSDRVLPPPARAPRARDHDTRRGGRAGPNMADQAG